MTNLIGQRFGRLTVLEKTNQRKHGYIVWKCQCDCGNIHYAYTYLLTRGGCKSCGCLHQDTIMKQTAERHKDLIGQRFGLLVVLEKDFTKRASNGGYMMKCQCDCGNIHYVSPTALRTRHTNSCGCLHISVGELKIKQLLDENNIPYEMEKSFDTCRSPFTNHPLRFDFFVNNSYLIEYDGKQHFDETTGWHREPLSVIQTRDEYKTNWCKENNIPLIRINYTNYDNLTIEDLLL